MPIKEKRHDPSIPDRENFEYRCTRCDKSWKVPKDHFYRVKYSECYKKNAYYSHLCKNCVNELFEKYEKKYNTKQACIFLCYKLDIPFYNQLFDSIMAKNNVFNIGMYFRQLNTRQYQNKDFTNTILEGELDKTDKEIEDEKEVKWLPEDKKNKKYVIESIGYDPFIDYKESDRRYLFNGLSPYLEDDELADDTFKLSQVIQIVHNNKQINDVNIRISQLNIVTDSEQIKELNQIKDALVKATDKIAKENEISVKNRSNKNVGKSTLTYLMKDLREKNFDKAEMDYYDQLSGQGSLWAIDMSMKAMLQNTLFDENDKQEIFEEQHKLINSLYQSNDDKDEEIRQLKIKIDKLKSESIESTNNGDDDG